MMRVQELMINAGRVLFVLYGRRDGILSSLHR